MPAFNAPRGSELKFTVNTDPVPELENISLQIQEDLALNFSSEFSPIFTKDVSNAEKIASDLFAKGTGMSLSTTYKEFGFQTWRSTSPASFEVTITLAMRTSGKKDVVDPAKALINLVLPDDTDENNIGGISLPGPNILNVLHVSETVDSSNMIIGCELGWMKFPSVVVKKATPVFSRHLDSEGYPIWCTISLQIETIYTATRQMIADAFG